MRRTMSLGLRGRILCAAGVATALAVLATAAVALLAVPPGQSGALALHLLVAGILIVAAVWLVLGAVLQRWVVRPLARTVRVMDRVRHGEQDFSTRLSTRGGREVAILNEGFNGLVQAIVQRDRELLAAREALDAGSRVKAQFMAVMSHELRTPLNAVVGMAELLHGTPLDARQQRFVTHIRQSARVLIDAIDDVLDLKHLDAGALRPVVLPFRLRDAVFDTVERYRDAAERRALKLSAHVDTTLPEVVRGDLMHLRQVLGNLLSNAIKFTERGSVVVRAASCDMGLRISVSDTGVGIAGDVMPHIYEAFRQGDGSPTRRFGGAGVGLSIAHRLCAAMGGRIDASSRPGKGTTFWFELPLPAVPSGSVEALAAGDLSALAGPAPQHGAPAAAPPADASDPAGGPAAEGAPGV